MSELLLSCQEIRKAYGDRPLFEGLSFGIFDGDQVGLVGPNGSGKSTLLRILAGLEEPDEGTRSVRKRLRLGYVTQDPSFGPEDTVEAVLHRALATDHAEEFEKSTRVIQALGRAGFDDVSRTTGTLSGGYRKRLAIACELVRAPDLLLMDEPTNHLDVEGILWLEEVLRSQPLAFVVVSHDRYFLESIAKRMLELNRVYPEGLLDVAGTYSVFLTRKDELLQGQASYQESLANRVRGEVEWLSRKAKARTRKAQARIDEAGRLIQELSDTRARRATATADIAFSATQRKTRQLVVAEGVHRAFGARPVLAGLDLTLSPGTRLGLLGPNGSGKTTLLRLLSGEDAPDAGSIEHAPALRTVVFDQHRAPLDPALSLRRSLAPDGDSVVHQGRSVHVAGWAKRFLFRAEQLETPVGRLSGGEQARVLIARLMLEPADLLLLDEPTNDLDIPTLEVLEEGLLEFPGALVLVTHDRYLLDRVSTQLLALDGKGGAQFFADLAQWEASQQAPAAAERTTPRNGASRAEPARPKRLSYKEKTEWEQMEGQILKAETRVERLREATHDPAVASDAAALQERYTALQAAEAEVARLYARWAELEAKQG